MSKYTTELRFICETAAGLTESEGYNSVNSIISKARSSIFNFDYPIFDASYRSVLETKILKHFYTREICAETVGRWKLFLDSKMNEIMPYYNQLYNSELIKFNPMYDTELTTDHTIGREGEEHGAGTLTSSGSKTESQTESETYEEEIVTDTDTTNTESRTLSKTGTYWEMFSDTPQGGITGLDNNDYLTNATKKTETENITEATNGSGTNDTTSTTDGTKETTTTLTGSDNRSQNSADDKNFSNTEQYVEHVLGKSTGTSYSKMLQEFRDTFLNIDMMIITELQPLFFTLW